MEQSPAYIIEKYLIAQGDVTAPVDSGDWPIYTGSLPDGNEAPNNAVGSMDSESVKDGRKMSDGENLFHYGVQLILRASAYNTGYSKMDALLTKLEAINRATITISGSSYRLDSVTLTTGIVVVGQEEGSKRRELFSLNFLVTLKEV